MSESDASSAKPGMSWWLILVTLLGGAFLFQRGRNQPEDKPAASAIVQERAESKVVTAEDRTLYPLRAFLGIEPPQVNSAENPTILKLDGTLPGGARLKASAEWSSKNSHSKAVDGRTALKERIADCVGLLEFLVVTVADPIDTATNLRFDMQLDALHKALGADNYLLDRFYMPWESSPRSEVHRTEPGVLLYRRNGGSKSGQKRPQTRSDLLLVYLIGETPTSGIHKSAFLAAIRQIRLLNETISSEARVSPGVIRVAGPLFTGAADSLALAVHQAYEENRAAKFQVITGGAISIDRARFKDLAGEGLLDFRATVLSGRILREALIEHVRKRATWESKVRIAWLTETGTGYGSSISVRSSKEPGGQHFAAPPPLDQTNSAAHADQGAAVEIIEFNFPVNISKVRAGYAESRRRERSGQLTLGPNSSRLPIPFEDTDTARDIPPMQTPKVTAPTAELILGQILNAIRNQGIRYVGISSSDPRDPIFLAELIYEHCPGVQIMLVSSDVLYTHSEYRSIMHGTLVASPYPLHPEAQSLCFPFGERRNGNIRNTILSSQVNYGLYNAVVFLRGLARGQFTNGQKEGNSDSNTTPVALQVLKEGAWPLAYSMPLEDNIAGNSLRPPVWISRISSAGIYPVTVRKAEEIGPGSVRKAEDIAYTLNLRIPKEFPAAARPTRHVPNYVPTSVYIANFLWLMLAALYCLAPWLPRRLGTWAEPLAPNYPCRHRRTFRGLMFVFRAYITSAFLYVLSLFGGLNYVLYRWHDEQQFSDFGPPLIQLSLCFLVGIVLCGYLLHDLGRTIGGVVADVWRMAGPWRASLRSRRASSPFRSLVENGRRAIWRRPGTTAGRMRTVLAACWRAFVNLMRGLFAHPAGFSAFGRANRAAPSAAMPTRARDWNWHLIAARVVGVMILLGLIVVHLWASTLQSSEWESEHPEGSFLWFLLTRDMFNGLSPAMTAQLLATALIVLTFGMLRQMHMLRELAVILPDPLGSAPPSQEEFARRQERVRRELVFPLLSRLRGDAPVVLYLLFVTAALLWLAFLGRQMQIPDHFVRPVNFPIMLLFFVGGFWCVRLCKLLLILNNFKRQLDDLTGALKERWPEDWSKIFGLLSEKPVGLHELFWAGQPKEDREWERAKQALLRIGPDEALWRSAEQKLCAVEIDRYVRQCFRHIVRLGLGLAISACLLFLIAQNYPFSREPLVRLSASVMLGAIGCLMAWYYLKFDRNELLSHLVGTDPKRISINWSLVQMVAPAVLLTAVALVSQAFPEIWQWMRSVLEPMARSSL